MRDPRRKKMLALRRAHLGGDNPSLYSMYKHISSDKEPSWRDPDWRTEFDKYHERCHLWIRKVTGLPYAHRYLFGNAPKWFRQDLNRNRRAKIKQAMRKINKGDYDAEIPKFRRNANWLWW